MTFPIEASPLPPYRLRISVAPSDLDALGHVNNVVYLGWINEVAIAHWESITTAEERSRLAWVALRHEIDYRSEALLGETIDVITWTGEAAGLRYSRHTRIEVADTGPRRTLVEARSIWCPIDPVRRRPARPEARIRALFAPPG